MATVVTAPAQVSSVRKPSPLALWHLLSLDAPTVAALWTAFFARTFAVPLPASAPLALGLSVWMLYAADRINDAAHGGDLKQRHHFHRGHRNAFIAALVCTVPLLILLTLHLPHGLRAGWLLLSWPLLLYVVVVHGLRMPRVPKEAVVGLFFGFATAMPVIMHGGTAWRSLPSMLFFTAVCYMNGIAISRWERSAHISTDALTAWLAQRLNTAGATLALVGALLLQQRGGRAVVLSCLFSIGLLLLLEKERTRFSSVRLRALADAALLTPLAVWPFLSIFTAK